VALNEINTPDKDRFYRDVQNITSDVSRLQAKLDAIVEWLADRTVADLNTIGVPSELHANIGALRTSLTTIRDAIAAEDAVLDAFRIMSII
jgi:hypothetical protein